jgi:3-hydroxybutyrate dehydrogenase
VICPGFVRTPLVDKRVPEQARKLGISEEEVARTVMLRETFDSEFSSTADVAETVLFLAAVGAIAARTRAIHGQSRAERLELAADKRSAEQ